MAPTVTRRRVLTPYSDGFRQFSDVLLLGLLIFLASLPIVTAFAALTAGVDVLAAARRVDGPVRVRAFAAALVARLRRWLSHIVVPVVVIVLLAADLLLLPLITASTTASAVIVGLLAAAALTAGVLFAAMLQPGERAAHAWGRTGAALGRAPGAAGMMLLASVTAIALVVIAPVLATVIAGPYVLAAVAVLVRLPHEITHARKAPHEDHR
ncbi:hypothetical protein [Microbacterium gorillae]|uniref:hypothetical protein n=1 Tax=Microbacterium gorillae TaxID=1231063 RepID=UPI003D9669CE